jgi:Amt family ammonium transporter
MSETELIPMWLLLANGLALLIPWGVALIVAGGLRPGQARQIALVPVAAFGLAVIGYAVVGFGLHYGGIGLLYDHPELNPLVWEWSALNEGWGDTWGMAGLAGFGLAGVQTPVVYLLFLSALPAATTATLLVMAALRGRVPALVTALFGLLTAAVGYPLVGNWIQGGGWLSRLDVNIGAGAGYIDFGMASLFLLGGGVALAGMLAFRPRRTEAERPSASPSALSPLLATLGTGLLVVGSTGWLLAWPLTDWTQTSAVSLIVLALLTAAAGGLSALIYTWLVTRHPDPVQGARGVTAGWVAGLAAVALVEPSQTLLIGAVAGLLMALVTHVLSRLKHFQDPGGILATFGIPAFWGILAVGVFSDAPGQLQAQTVGAATIFLLAFLAASVVAVPLALIGRAWRGRRAKMMDEPEKEEDTDTDSEKLG